MCVILAPRTTHQSTAPRSFIQTMFSPSSKLLACRDVALPAAELIVDRLLASRRFPEAIDRGQAVHETGREQRSPDRHAECRSADVVGGAALPGVPDHVD